MIAVPPSLNRISPPSASKIMSPATSTVKSPELKSISVPSIVMLSIVTPASMSTGTANEAVSLPASILNAFACPLDSTLKSKSAESSLITIPPEPGSNLMYSVRAPAVMALIKISPSSVPSLTSLALADISP